MTPDERAALIVRLSPDVAAGLTAYGEARGESVSGIVAVLSVLQTRAQQKQRSLADVALQPYQFSCWNENDPNSAILQQYAEAHLSGAPWPYDPVLDVCLFLGDKLAQGELRSNVGEATHYYNPMTVAAPAWSLPPAKRVTVIGHHTFYTGVAW